MDYTEVSEGIRVVAVWAIHEFITTDVAEVKKIGYQTNVFAHC